MTVKAIVADVNAQYVKDLEEDYTGYKKKTTKTMVTQLQIWCAITTKEKLAIKFHSLTPWSDTPISHITTFAL